MSAQEQSTNAPEAAQPGATVSTLHVEATSFRDDGKGYIDEPSGIAADPAPTDHASNIEQRDDDDLTEDSSEEEDDEWAAEELDVEAVDPELLDQDEEHDWDVDDEDWELADGDFTKQYNRVRQQYDATHTEAGPSSLRTAAKPQTTTAAPRRPLPARNVHVPNGPSGSGAQAKRLVHPALLATGVSANPKAADRAVTKDKADRATHEQVLDARTRLVLSSLVNRGFFSIIEYCVSTGKEANVYFAHPPASPPTEPSPYPSALAVKIYRTSILNFRARQSYIVGEHRFRGGYASAKNPRKMVRLWAEKELRNLRRLVQGGVRAPVVIEQKENVLVMEYLGQGNTASPRLKDAEISMSKLPRLYAELLVAMRRMYNRCHLVHADLSEYNILYHDSHLYIIDVSQSVEHDHPSGFDFLRSDIRNVEDFFTRRSGGEVRTLGVRRTWDFVTRESLGMCADDEDGDEGEERLFDVIRSWIDAAPEQADAEGADDDDDVHDDERARAQAAQDAKQTDDNVFMSSYIPRSLAEVYNPERDIDVLKADGAEQLIYAGVTGLSLDAGAGPVGRKGDEASVRFDDEAMVKAQADGEGDKDQSDGSDAEGDGDGGERKSRGFRNEDKEANKLRKKALKEENREKRKKKMPKAEKQRLIKKTSGK